MNTITPQAFVRDAHATIEQVHKNPESARRLSKSLADNSWSAINPQSIPKLSPEQRYDFIGALELGALSCEIALKHVQKTSVLAEIRMRRQQFLVDASLQKIELHPDDVEAAESLSGISEDIGSRHIEDKELFHLGIAASVGAARVRINQGEAHEYVLEPIARYCVNETWRLLQRQNPPTEGQLQNTAMMGYFTTRLLCWYLAEKGMEYIRLTLRRERGTTKSGSYELLEQSGGVQQRLYIRQFLDRGSIPEVPVIFPHPPVWPLEKRMQFLETMKAALAVNGRTSSQRHLLKDMLLDMNFAPVRQRKYK